MSRSRVFAAELIGTLLLLAIVVGSGIMGERLAAVTTPSPCSPTPPRPQAACMC